MYTDCPNCHTYFKITLEQLKAAEGKVRCGSCNHVFNAVTNLVEKVPPASSRVATSRVSSVAESVVSAPVGESDLANNISLPVNSESIDLADTLSPTDTFALDEVEEMSGSLSEASVSAASRRDVLDDINKDIDDALNDLFDDDSQVVKSPPQDSLQVKGGLSESKFRQQSSVAEPKVIGDKRKKDATLESGASEFDLDGFDDLLFEKSDSDGPPLEAMSENDSFMSSEPLGRHEVEWETLTRPAKPPSPPKLSKLEAMKSRMGEGFNVSRTMWIVIICFLTIVLLGQFAYSKHEQLVKYAPLRAVLEQACAVIDIVVSCEIPNPRDVEAFVISDSNVVGHPNAENALLITSTISNEAEFTQKFPELVLTFLDINQQILARRAFTPEEYLSNRTDIDSGMRPNEPVKIMLEIVDPGEAAVNFEFDFR